jgi:glycosyltransferase involved in cell wall biosynthesis
VPAAYSIHYPAYQYVDISAAGRFVNAQIERIFNWLLTDRVVFPYRNTYHQALKRRIVRKGQACLIPSGIDVGPFIRADQAIGGREKTCQGNAPEVCRLVLVARLSIEKNVSLALQTIAELDGRGYLAALLVLGDGPLRGDLEAEARQLGISGEVQFLGYRQDIPQVLAQADIVLMTSMFEAGPYVVMEAMAAGRPVVATPVGDVPWLLQDDAGVVVDDPTPERFASAVADLIENEARRKRIGRLAQKKAVAEFSLDAMLAGYRQLYIDMIGGGR